MHNKRNKLLLQSMLVAEAKEAKDVKALNSP